MVASGHRSRVLTKGVDPQVSCTYKSSRIKQYFKEHRALRTEVVVGDTRDFLKRLTPSPLPMWSPSTR